MQARQGLTNGAPEPGCSSQGLSWEERRPWMKSGSGVVARQAEPRQLTKRAEPTMKVERACEDQRRALSDGSHARLWPPATAALARFDNPRLGLSWQHHGLCVPPSGPATPQTCWSEQERPLLPIPAQLRHMEEKAGAGSHSSGTRMSPPGPGLLRGNLPTAPH